MTCGAFKESADRLLHLEDINEVEFMEILSLACGSGDLTLNESSHILRIARLADRFQISEVATVLEDALLRHLTVDSCAEILTGTVSSGLTRAEQASRALATQWFEEMSLSAGFLQMNEDVLESLLQDDGLASDGEESIFEALMRWVRARGSGDGRTAPSQSLLLRHIRFPLMNPAYLATTVRQALPAASASYLDAMLEEAERLARGVQPPPADPRNKLDRCSGQEVCTEHALRELGPRALVPRLGRGVPWANYAAASGSSSTACIGAGAGVGAMPRRLRPERGVIFTLVEWGQRVCAGLAEGGIRVWDRNTFEEEEQLDLEGKAGGVLCLAVWGNKLVSGHCNGSVRVWEEEPAGNRCRTADGPEPAGGSRTVSALSAMAFAAAANGAVPNEAKPPGGRRFRMWTLEGHTMEVNALAACGRRLLSASDDCTIRVWGPARAEFGRRATSGARLEGKVSDGAASGSCAAAGSSDFGRDSSKNGLQCVCERGLACTCSRAPSQGGREDQPRRGCREATRRVEEERDVEYVCERVVVGHEDWVLSLVVWAGRALSSSADCTIRVWDPCTGAAEATLRGHKLSVVEILVAGGRLYSCSVDRTIRVWALAAGGWAPLRTVEAYAAGSGLYPCCIALCGRKLVTGSSHSCPRGAGEARHEVCVWDAQGMTCELALPQPPGARVLAVLGTKGALWAAVGCEVAVWGRAGR